LPRTIQFALPLLLRRLLLLRTEGLPVSQRVLLPSINVLRSLAPLGLLENPVADPLALCPNGRQLLNETPDRQCELSVALSHKVISDCVPPLYHPAPGLK
jgi:hypothetical protein